jgi:hypothetical protein
MKARSRRGSRQKAPVDLNRLLQVKFKNGLRPGIHRHRLVVQDARASVRRTLASIHGTWHKFHTSSRRSLDALMQRARRRKSRRPLPDLLSYYVLYLAAAEDVVDVAKRLSGLKEVEYVDLMPRPYPLAIAPDLDSSGNETGSFQGYLEPFNLAAGTTGIGAKLAWYGYLTGGGIRFCDVEYNFNRNHRELKDRVTILGGDPVNPMGLDADDVTSHGTSVMGEFGSKRGDDQGTVGIAHDAALFFSPVITSLWPNIGDAISRAAVVFDEGDIIIVEQQIPGPGRSLDSDGQDGLVAVEWDRGIYDAIVVAVDAGLTVVEAAGNGSNGFDSELFLRAGINRGHHPFQRQNDSGAIIVGAGGSTSQIKRSSSNFGERVDLQGWGDSIVSASGPTVRSDLWTEDGVNREYTSSFAGTSGATPIVAGACALVQQAFKARYNRAATCQELRAILVATGNPQQPNQNGVVAKIGPLPDVPKAVDLVRGVVAPPVFDPDPAGLYDRVSVRIQYGAGTGFANAVIRYTLDTSEPTEESRQFRPAGRRRSRLILTESTLVKAKTFLTSPDPYDGTLRSSHVVHGNYQIYDPSLPVPDLYFDEIDPYSGDHIIGVHVESGYTLGVNSMIWYNVNQDVEPVQFVGPNVMYVGRIKFSQPGTYVVKSRYYEHDSSRFTWTPGPVATHTFTV